MTNIKFKGIMPALITPVDSNGRVNANTVKELIEFQFSKGVNGFYVNGSTGEGPSLSIVERMDMSEYVMDNIKGRGVVIEHVGAPSYADAVILTKHAHEVGVDAISSLVPNFYFSFTDNEIVDYYKSLAEISDKPLIVYVTPLMKTDVVTLVKRLLEIPTIIGLKFTLPDYFLMRKLCELNDGNINIINGPDETLICGLTMGAQGGIGSTYNLMPDLYSQLYKSFIQGDFELARELQYRVNRVIDILIKHSENSVIKALKESLKLMGFDAGNAVYPSKTFTKTEITALKNDLMAAGLAV